MRHPRVAVVGGGLAGLAAAASLTDTSCEVHLFESRRQLGGRAASYRDSVTGELVDFCQHVSMGCCTNLTDFCRKTGVESSFRREPVLNFIGPDGELSYLAASRWLPAPLHLGPALLRLRFLTFQERVSIAHTLLSMARSRVAVKSEPTIGEWLESYRQSRNAIDRFWSVILESALGDNLNKASFSAARKVFVDGFMGHRNGYEVFIPTRPLSELFGDNVGQWLRDRGVAVTTSAAIDSIDRDRNEGFRIAQNGQSMRFDHVIVSVPWRQIQALIAPRLQTALPWLSQVAEFKASPITGVHLWFDRPITELRNVVLVGRLSQWVFNRQRDINGGDTSHYYQVVVSASREIANCPRDEVVAKICEELRTIWPAARDARLFQSKVVNEPHAVFSTTPGLDALRPSQQTALSGLYVAGDWTATGWPGTMEGAVRSGYLAAEGVLRDIGMPRRLLVDDLPKGWLSRMLCRSTG